MISDLQTFANKGCKIAVQKKSLLFGDFCLTSRIILVSVLLSASVERCFVSRKWDFFPFFPQFLLARENVFFCLKEQAFEEGWSGKAY